MSVMTMRPMSLSESGDSTQQVSLSKLFDDPKNVEGATESDIETMAHLVCRGGWPEAVTASDSRAGLLMARDYIRMIAEEDISDVDGVQRNYRYALLVMAAYARCTATQADMTAVRSNLKSRGGEMSRNTVSAYVSALRRLYVFEDLEGWKPSLRDKTRITSTPARHFVCPSLAAAAMGATPSMLLSDMPTLGLLFESLCVRDLRVYANAAGGTLYHYHDDAGREADAVIVLEDGRWALVEAKMGSGGIEEGAQNLVKLAGKIDQAVMGPPSFLMVLAPTRYAHRRPDCVIVAPLACLTA